MEVSDTTPVDDDGAWVFYVGNVSVDAFPHETPNTDLRRKLHPRTTQAELYDLFKSEGGDSIRNIIIRSARGCSVTVIPDKAMTPSDRCYASVEVKGFGATWTALKKYSEDPPILHGFPLVVKLSVADMPEVSEILGRTMASLVGTKRKYVVVVRLFGLLFADNRFRRTKRRAPKRLAMQKTESVIGGQQKSLVGPSRGFAKPKRRPNPTGGAR